ncbi:MULTISPECIES: D-proline reductase (dithiol) proprotein PrdA [Lachnospiraceae]|uniref:D-proline reductase (dithiol) proprotein PrdA n=1 Tax=Lachnospiraceae TaxID=186803 RepID=UPI0006737AF9|nr:MULTISPECIES: D-proline reductase (dithiol) proprotein PrdA [Lachnospiraceae]KMZ53164.1 D-proline reductase, PrdA proprotein [Dorea sp. D27]MBO1722304.1 D-proline reductase (dithiol) proprotein PrdA [Extibacter sp. GGCC_0201]BDF32348.1 D-proline reductase (dithiol) proprotein PrdA [Lachnospiraceae bacterium]BDF36358.1 D-proline reductase (dithiol) proprotein PrdA [Lachnospiraceae bacterium]
MSITAETAKEHAHDPAVLCCRAEAGVTIEAANLEDPAIFDDLVDSGLLNLDGALTIEQVLGAKLTKTCDSLCPLTADVVEGAKAPSAPAAEEAPEEEAPAAPAPVAPPVAGPAAGGTLKIHIGEGKDIDLEIPVGALGGGAAAVAPLPAGAEAAVAGAAAPEAAGEEKVVRSLTRKHFTITEVKRGPETKIEGTTLYIREGIEADVIADQDLVKDFKLEVITPDLYHTYSETVMDVQPIATKEGDDVVGEGVTRVLDGVVMMLTGVDEGGVQIGEFGSSEGYLDENIMWNRPSCPDKGEIFIKGNIVVQEKTNMERRGPMAAHTAFDLITQEIREVMKKLDESLVSDTEELKQVRRPGKKKVVIVKEIMGQGAMHDNFILPVEPVGVLGARANVDLGNVPVCVSPLEVLDGCIHALTCIGPASKEMSRHYWREPLVLEALHDPEVDLCGVVFVGSPQINAEKFYVSRRVGMTVEAMDADGAFVTTEGFGNNHIDFASHIEQIGMRGTPVVGMSYCAVQGALVVGNKYMNYMVDNNKSEAGIENEILGNNTLCQEDAVRALAMLKAAMAGEDVKAAEKKWNPNVKSTNVELIEAAAGVKVDLVENEQSLPMSQKRKEKYS